jgi:hypothetical protein
MKKEYFDNLTTIHSTRSLHCKQTFGGFLLRRTRMVCKITLEKRGPISTNSSNLHISPHILHQIYQTIWLSHILQSTENIHLSRISWTRKWICWLCMTHTDCTLCLKLVWKSDTSVHLGKCGKPTDNELAMLTMVSKILLLVPLSRKTYITKYHTGYFKNT